MTNTDSLQTLEERLRDMNEALLISSVHQHELTDLAEKAGIANAKLAAIIEFSDDAIISKDLGGVITSWNKAAERLFGYTSEEIVGKPVTTLIPPDRLDEEPMILSRIRRGESIEHYETVRRCKDGRLLNISLTVSPIKNDAGRVIGASKVARDITERKAADDALRKSEARLAAELASTTALHEVSRQLIRQDDPESLYLCLLNSAVEIMHSDFASVQMLYPKRGPAGSGAELRLLGHRGFTAEAAKAWEWLRADDATTCGMALRTGTRCIVADIEKCDFMAGTDALRAYRETGIRAVQSTPLVSRSGTTVGMISTHWRNPHEAAEDDFRRFDILARMAADLIERRQAEEALAQSEERYRTIFDLGPVAIYSINSLGMIQAFNHQAGRLWGRDPVIGDSDERFCGSFRMYRPDGTFMPHDECPMADVVSGRLSEIVDAEVIIERPDGSRVTVIVNIRPLKNIHGEVNGAVNCFYDISERVALENQVRQQAESLADESRRKDEFLAMLSHELRNPLAPIRSAVHLLRLQERSGGENLIGQQAREVIERQVGNLTKLVGDLLEVSRVVSGRIRLDRQTVDLNQVIKHAIETVTPLMEQHRHTLVLNLCPEPIWCEADVTRMEEVLINLLNNAAKYTPECGRIEVWCEHARGQNFVQVRIRDNGVGIDAKLMPRIFDLFTQADRSLDRAAGGLGIGLSLAHRLIDLHGGTITAHSPPEGQTQGSEFIVRLPRMTATGRPLAAPVEQPARRSSNGSGKRVLVVDDNIDQVTMLTRALRLSGYNVESAYSGPDGFKLALNWRPDIVLLDIGLPGLDGYELARRLRSDPSLREAGATMSLIALTGYGRDNDIARARESGFDAHLIKPFDLDELEKLMVDCEN